MNKIALLLLLVLFYSCKRDNNVVHEERHDEPYAEKHRPLVHFSPESGWMNDPNGLVFHNGEFHLFYQYYPHGNVWGPMHWGHAVSGDLVHWDHLPIALYPDSLGYIFSGSAVLDSMNTSGLGTKENPPLVAIFTYHSTPMEQAGRTDYQCQGIAYSGDNGITWTKYKGNPIIKNQGVNDFRDPKVFWHKETEKWVMILAVKDHVELWNSADLKSWSKLSDFGKNLGAHGGVWECPDLFPLPVDGGFKWVMLLSINPGGPNGGSATQYFVGDFDGTTFKSDPRKHSTVWMDYGPDNYAGVTWSNAPDNRKILIGWMSNWNYGQQVPTTEWRSAMTLPRDLSLKKVGSDLFLTSQLSPEVSKLVEGNEVAINEAIDLSSGSGGTMIKASYPADNFSIEILNSAGERLLIGFNAAGNYFYIDRSRCGKNDFSKDFSRVVTAPRFIKDQPVNVVAVVDASSVEVFFDDGLTVLTSIYFPNERLDKVVVNREESSPKTISIQPLKSIWKKTKS